MALKLLEYALLMEGDGYWKRLENLRREALELMGVLAKFKPKLVGSVWRGIIKPGSDIDIEVDCQDPEPVKRALAESGYEVLGQEPVSVPEPLRYGSLWKIKVNTKSGKQAEIILKEHRWHLNPPKCDIFGDPKKGLNMVELRKVLKEEPARLFIPRRSLRNGVR
ncbi:MAG: hypothetical protein J7L83_01190 [Thaumarchaeota archaeon]|nr:hypothetical protein [Nitrososphaerota archaeon]